MSDVLVVAEHRRGELRPVSYELLAAGLELGAATKGDVHAVVIGPTAESMAESLNRSDVDAVHAVQHSQEFNHDVTCQVLAERWAELEPSYLVAPHSVNGLDYAPAIAQRLDLPLVTDVTDLEFVDHLEVVREQYGSKVETTVAVDQPRAVITVREGEWPHATGAGAATVTTHDVEVDESAVHTSVTGLQDVTGGDVDISDAEFVVAIGRGIEEEENLDLIERLAEVSGGTLAASRPVVDNGWLPHDRQVGQSGTAVSPEIYLAIGISGAVQHVAGIKDADAIVAINEDPDAPIFDVADYGIVDDLFDVVPALIEALGGEPP